ncbi:MAG: phage tail tape measure protein, partial [Polyangiaceae bacterium]|nr:phage tail tape measure protein [Polyangiaceae bacterium]
VFTTGAATVGAALSLANAAGRFEQAVAGVAAVSGATAQELGQLRDAAVAAGVATQFSPVEAAQGLRDLAQAGFNAQESMGLLLPVLDLAAGSLGELSPQAAAGLAAQSIKAFGLSVDEAGGAVDRILKSVNVFAISAGELPLALGTASRGAQAMHQSLSETLVSLGLVKNIIPSVERASTAVAVAMERMADPRVQQALRGVGVSVTDSQNRFRSFLDILGDLAPQLDRMSEAQRSAFLLSTFGREALGGVNAILTQVTNGVRTNTGETVRGAAAIAYLRDQFENAGGTAARFREQMLDTFEGQKQLLSGSLETLAIVAGEPFAQVFKPIVTIVVDVVNAVLDAFRQLPAPAKRAFAAFVVGAGAVVALVGAVIAAKAGVALLVIGLNAAGITLGGLLATVLPAVLIFGALALAVAGFVVAFRDNVGGIADFAARVWERIKLAFQGLVQLFEQGGLSGAVREELNRAENAGLKTFLIRVYQFAFRIQRFFQGIGEGFSAAIEAAQPVFEAFASALSRLGEALGLVSSEGANAAAGIPSDDFAEFGRILGQIAGVLVEVFVGTLSFVIDVVSSAIGAFRTAIAPLTPIFDAVRNAVGLVFQELGKLGAMFGFTSSASGQTGGALDALRSIAEFLGTVIGYVAAGIAGAIGVMVQFVVNRLAVFIAAFRSVVGFIGGVIDIVGGLVTGNWAQVWVGFKAVVVNAINFLAQLLLGFVEMTAGIIDSIGAIFGAGLGGADAIRSLRQEVERGLLGGLDEVTAGVQIAPQGQTLATLDAATSTMPAVAAMTPVVPASFPMTPAAPPASPPVVVNLQVDGQTLATAVHRADRDTATRSFSPVPAY